MGLVEEHIKLTNGIVSGELNREQVATEINRIESEYGEDSFDSYAVKRKNAPWTKYDLEDLEVQSASGACSKDFYLYMAEVSEYVHRSNDKRGLFGSIEKVIKFIAKNWLAILIFIAFVALVIWGISRFLR